MKKSKIVLPILFLILVGCRLDTSGQYTYQQPEGISDGIEVGTLNEVNIDVEPIEDGINEIINGRFREVHSILIYRKGKLVLEEYFQGHKFQWEAPGHHGEWVTWNKDMLHVIQSDTKSITSICVGIAIDEGYIEDIHQSIFDYLPEYQHLKTDGKEKITIEHLVTMTSGLEWDEWGAPLSSADNDIIGLWFNCDDQITCILEKPLVKEPGTSFTYCGANQILLGEIIKNASGMNIDEFSKRYLFDPLGSDSVQWATRFPNGVFEAAGGLKLRPRDMLKVGVTLLNEGKWNDNQIVSRKWVEKSAEVYKDNRRINVPGSDGGRHGYSYSWWTHEFRKSGKAIGSYYAGGWGGQKIMVIPDLDAVVVLTGGTYTSQVRSFALLEKYIVPAFN